MTVKKFITCTLLLVAFSTLAFSQSYSSGAFGLRPFSDGNGQYPIAAICAGAKSFSLQELTVSGWMNPGSEGYAQFGLWYVPSLPSPDMAVAYGATPNIFGSPAASATVYQYPSAVKLTLGGGPGVMLPRARVISFDGNPHALYKSSGSPLTVNSGCLLLTIGSGPAVANMQYLNWDSEFSE